MPTIDRTVATNYHDATTSTLRKVGGYTGPAAYVAGGESFTPADLGVGKLHLVLFAEALDAALALRHVVWNPATQKAVWFVGTTGVEVAGGVNLSTFSVRFEAICN